MTCRVITGKIFCNHHLEGHPENRDRLRLAFSGVPKVARRLEPVGAAMDDLERVHRREYITWLRGISAGECYIDFNTYICPDSFEVARYAAGSCIRAAGEALDGHNCFALVRPPGHHAEPGRAGGYCLLNNVAIAAARALESVDRLAIIDWDLHHGNGTQEIFYASDRVLFCSIHKDGGYPGSGKAEETGTGAGQGFTLNAPLKDGCGIADYRLVFREVFCPALEGFRPDLVIVSAGQDALADDPKAVMNLVPADYGILTRMLMDAADLPLALALEGGYGPSLGRAIGAIFRTLGGRPVHEDPPVPAARTTRDLVRILKRVHGW
jgi:acetoin utilization deacetylase AcuC-like enzyme